MAEIKKFTRFEDFEEFNRDFISTNPMLYFHLENTIERVLKGKATLYNFFNITDENFFVSALLIKDECLIYANNVNDEVVTKLAEGLEFHLFRRYEFFGTKQIIDALFKKYEVEFDEQKHRIIYECKVVNSDFSYSPGSMAMADVQRINELARFNVDFTREYYDDLQDFEKALHIVASGIYADNLYQWNYKDEICAIAQAIHDEHEFPVIGQVFTNPKFRKKGYAASIVHRLTKGLLNAGNEKCLLTTNAYNPASNKAFKRVGYIPTGEYVMRYKKK